jgi:hypothetical protein
MSVEPSSRHRHDEFDLRIVSPQFRMEGVQPDRFVGKVPQRERHAASPFFSMQREVPDDRTIANNPYFDRHIGSGGAA